MKALVCNEFAPPEQLDLEAATHAGSWQGRDSD